MRAKITLKYHLKGLSIYYLNLYYVNKVFYPEDTCEKLSQLKEDKLKSSEYVKINEEKRVRYFFE
jgi:hypothetical protein